jgi:uncharacterized delta-60 repeat protein
LRGTLRRAFLPAALLAALVVLLVGPAQATPGDLDPSFGTGGKVTTPFGTRFDEVDGLALQPDGKIVAAGYVEPLSTGEDFGLARYNPDGSLDTSFGSGGKVTTSFGSDRDYATQVVVQPDGKIVAAGRALVGPVATGVYEFGLARYNPDGSLDSGFGTGGKVTTAIGTYDIARGLALQADGKIVVSGYTYSAGFSTAQFALARYNPNGSLDTSFGTAGTVRTQIGTTYDFGAGLAIQPDGKIVVTGYSNNGSNYDFAVVRYNPDGSLDSTFGTGGKVTTPVGTLGGNAYAVGIQADGKIVVSGQANAAGDSDFALVRYNPDGSLDSSFGTGGKVTTPIGPSYDNAYALRLQPNGKIVVAGWHRVTGAPTYYYSFAVARYTSNGSLDTSFGTGGLITTPFGPYDNYAVDLVVQPDGKIVVGGSSQRIDTDTNDYEFALERLAGDSHTLTATRKGSGKGTVGSTPVGIDCGSACAAQFADHSSVALTATAAAKSKFIGWAGACSGRGDCTVTMDGDQRVTAEFALCVVPKVKGKRVRSARSSIRRHHCSVGKIKRRYSKVKKGRVSGQKPKPGTKQRYGGKVNLVVSKGPRP